MTRLPAAGLNWTVTEPNGTVVICGVTEAMQLRPKRVCGQVIDSPSPTSDTCTGLLAADAPALLLPAWTITHARIDAAISDWSSFTGWIDPFLICLAPTLLAGRLSAA